MGRGAKKCGRTLLPQVVAGSTKEPLAYTESVTQGVFGETMPPLVSGRAIGGR